MATTRRVQYVDADEDRRTQVAAALRSDDLAVETCGTVADAVAASDDTDVVVTERDLPDGTWRTLFDRLAGTPVVLYTADGDESLAGAALAAGVDGYVPASDGVDVLRERVHAAACDTDSQHILDQSPMAIVEWERGNHLVTWNRTAEELFGYTAAEALGEQPADFMLPTDADLEAPDIWDAVTEAGRGWHIINENVRKDGETITCEWHNAPIVEDGEVKRVISFARDVTDQSRRTHALEALQETTRELLRADSRAEVAQCAVEAAGRVLGQSISTLRLYERSTDALELAAATDAARDVFDAFPPIGPGDDVLWEVFVDGELRVVENAPDVDTVHDDMPVSRGLVVPLGEHGVMTCMAADDTAFDDTDRHLAEVLAGTTRAALDRTEREHALLRRERMLQAAGDGVYVLDEDGRFTMVNDRLLELTGYERSELLGSHASVVITPEDVDRARGHIADLLETGGVRTYEVTITGPNGERTPVEISKTLVPDGESFSGTIGVVRDVTERTEMQRELRERKVKIETLHEVARDLESCQTPQAVWTRAVEAAEGVLAFDECGIDEVVDDHLVVRATSSEMLPEGYVERTPISDGIAGRTHQTGETYRVDDLTEDEDATPEDDAYRSLLSVPIGDRGVFQAVSREVGAFDETDADLAELLLAHVGNALDRLDYEAELREQRDRFAALFENVPDPVVYAEYQDGQPIVRAANSAFAATFGVDPDRVEGQNLDDLVVPPDRREAGREITRTVAQDGVIVEEEVKRSTADGLRDFLLTVVPVDLGTENEYTFGVYTDITERKQRQQRVEVLNRVLRHDLRNGMNIIKGAAEMLAEVVDDAERHYAGIIEERADDLIGMAEKTRAVERTLERDPDLQEPVDVVESVHRACEAIRQEFPDATVTADVPEHAYVESDDLLDTALYHVLENACTHNDRRPEIEVSVRTEDDQTTIAVADNGPGIPEEESELLTEQREITQLRHASGLGLWLVNWVVKQAGGTLSFETAGARGTVVTVELPAAAPKQEL